MEVMEIKHETSKKTTFFLSHSQLAPLSTSLSRSLSQLMQRYERKGSFLDCEPTQTRGVLSQKHVHTLTVSCELPFLRLTSCDWLEGFLKFLEGNIFTLLQLFTMSGSWLLLPTLGHVYEHYSLKILDKSRKCTALT